MRSGIFPPLFMYELSLHAVRGLEEAAEPLAGLRPAAGQGILTDRSRLKPKAVIDRCVAYLRNADKDYGARVDGQYFMLYSSQRGVLRAFERVLFAALEIFGQGLY